ncbi:polymerase delta-interacting protein 2-like protein, partial [Tanacetum coccineum]
GIRVQVRSVYIEGRSQPLRGQYFFAYRIRITNNSDRPVQLLKRHWIITNANEKSEDVWGIGVIGEQPVILPNNSFEYSSACPLTTPSGRMEGDFEMKHIYKVGSKTFNVAVAPFALSTFGDSTDNI